MDDLTRKSHEDLQNRMFEANESAFNFGIEFIETGKLKNLIDWMFKHMTEKEVLKFLKENRPVFEDFGWTEETNRIWKNRKNIIQ